MLNTPEVEEIAALRLKVSALEALLFADRDGYRVKLGLTPNEASVFAALINAGGYVSRDELALAMMGGHDNAGSKSTLGVVMHRIRGKLRRFGITIETIWGGGFKVDVEKTKAILEAL